MSDTKEHDRIWLQTCGDSMSEWCGEITWCQDKVHDDDVGYVNAKLYAQLEAENAALKEHVADHQRKVNRRAANGRQRGRLSMENAPRNNGASSGTSALDDGLGSKWCYYCGKDTHNDAECNSTRPKDWQPTCQPALTLCPTCGNDFRKCVAMRPNCCSRTTQQHSTASSNCGRASR